MFIALCSFAFTIVVNAQTQTTGRIAGTVKDPNGARILRAQVAIINSETGQERRTVTDDQGAYSVALISPGSYLVKITVPGFAPSVFSPVIVAITETTTVDADMILAGPDTVSIQIDSLIQRDGPQLGRVVEA